MTKNFGSLVKAGFKRGMEEGKRGSTTWRVTWGLKREPFSGAEELREVFVDREEAVVQLARGLGRGVMGLHEVIACIGPHGGGVSATLSIVHNALVESDKVKGVFEKAARFLEVRERKDARRRGPPLFLQPAQAWTLQLPCGSVVDLTDTLSCGLVDLDVALGGVGRRSLVFRGVH